MRLLLLLFLLQANYSFSQTLQLYFCPKFGTDTLSLATTDYTNGDLTISRLRFYISNIQLIQSNKVVWKEENSFHLIDAEKATSTKLLLPIPEDISFDQIAFTWGIDSVTNVSGAMGGDLDPTKGMYWAWNSGYINFKLEGTHKDCPSRKNKFQLHLGGYAAPFQNAVSLVFATQSKKLTFTLPLEKYLNQVDWANQHSIMSPSQLAKEQAQFIAHLLQLETSKFD